MNLFYYFFIVPSIIVFVKGIYYKNMTAPSQKLREGGTVREGERESRAAGESGQGIQGLRNERLHEVPSFTNSLQDTLYHTIF